MYAGGYTGTILRIDLTSQTATREPLPLQIAQDYLGGAGFGIKYLYDEVPQGTDPLGPGNKLIFAPGPFTGTTIPCASRMAVVTRSPLTGAVGMATTGGFFPAEMKMAGYDVLIVEGKAEKPTILIIRGEDVTFRDGDWLWGTVTVDCQQLLKDDLHDQNVRIACIGPAGENQSLMASIINERRAFGRKGVGAVMGSKNLKAIAMRGTEAPHIADEAAFKVARAQHAPEHEGEPGAVLRVRQVGNAHGRRPHHESGHLPGQELVGYRASSCRSSNSAWRRKSRATCAATPASTVRSPAARSRSPARARTRA